VNTSHFSIRKAIAADIPAIWRVRYSVQENILPPGVISDADVQDHLEVIGSGWVCEQAGAICAFAIGNARNGQVWALFVEPHAQGCGIGSALHAVLLEWFCQQPIRRLWLTTAKGSRSQQFYEKHGWHCVGTAGKSEVRYERENAAQHSAGAN
jgi:GNAT superfamily N-acetyltransferase